jgi:hypothetical protein
MAPAGGVGPVCQLYSLLKQERFFLSLDKIWAYLPCNQKKNRKVKSTNLL